MTCSYPDLGEWGGRKPTDAEEQATLLAESLAWSSILQLTAGRVTVCPVTVRPVRQDGVWLTWITAPVGTYVGSSTEYLRLPPDGLVLRGVLGDLGGMTSDYGHRAIRLERPVGQVDSVTIDGATLSPTAWRIDDGNVLVRMDGSTWPQQQDLTLPLGQSGTWSITYYQGYRPNGTLIYATGILAAEFYRAIAGDKRCRLPERVTAVTRQGVSFQMPADIFADGRTGIREVDTVLRIYNPNGLRAAPVIVSPDSYRRRARTVG